MIPAHVEESSREICGSTHPVMLSEGAEFPSGHGQWVKGGVGRGTGFSKNNNIFKKSPLYFSNSSSNIPRPN